MQARKDPTQRSLEARLRNARLLAEAAKFRLAPFGTLFSLLKALLDDFSGHNVDAAAALVEGAGRFLFRLPESQTRMGNMLEVRVESVCRVQGRRDCAGRGMGWQVRLPATPIHLPTMPMTLPWLMPCKS